MSVQTIARRFAELCRSGQNLQALEELYADDAVSIEAASMPGMEQIVRGREALIGKNQWWIGAHDVHAVELQGPYPHDEDRFACHWSIDVTHKPSGQRMQMQEIGVFEVRDGKIVEERYFYDLPPA